MHKLTKEEVKTQRTYDRLAKKWSSTHSTKSFWGEEMKRFHAFLPSGKVLEIGSGAGRDAKELISYGYDYLGTDYSKRLIERAQENNPGIAFENTSLYDLDFPQQFDGFWCAAVLLHIPKTRIRKALQAIISNIKPGGIGFISVKEGMGEAVEARGGVKGYDRLISYWPKQSFKDLLATEGLRIIYEGEKPYNDSVWLTYIVQLPI